MTDQMEIIFRRLQIFQYIHLLFNVWLKILLSLKILSYNCLTTFYNVIVRLVVYECPIVGPKQKKEYKGWRKSRRLVGNRTWQWCFYVCLGTWPGWKIAVYSWIIICFMGLWRFHLIPCLFNHKVKTIQKAFPTWFSQTEITQCNNYK